MRCASLVVPSARLVSTWVSPRVNRPEPWTRGRMPASVVMSRISSALRPSGRCFSTAMRRRMMLFCSASKARPKSAEASGSGSAPRIDSAAAERTAATLSRRSSLACSRVASARSLPNDFSTLAASLSSTTIGATSHLGLPAFFCSSSCAAQRVRISSWAIWRASSIVSSSTSVAPASTIEIASTVPATTRSSSDSSVSCSVGLMMNSSPIRPMRTAPTGPWKGISESMRAIEAPLSARMSKAFTWSTERIVATTCVSLR